MKSKDDLLNIEDSKLENESGNIKLKNDQIQQLKVQLDDAMYTMANFDKAEEICSQILTINPYENEIRLRRALIRENLSKYQEALSDACIVITLNENNIG